MYQKAAPCPWPIFTARLSRHQLHGSAPCRGCGWPSSRAVTFARPTEVLLFATRWSGHAHW